MESPGAEGPLMPEPTAAPEQSRGPDYKDRSTALIVFGIVEILGGGMAALAIPLILLSVVMAQKSGNSLPMVKGMVVPVITYGFLAVILVTLGIGAIMAKRWAWALNLILSWVWLILGTLGTIALTVVMPSSFLEGMRGAAENNPNAGGVSTGVMAAILTFFIVLMAIFFVVVPLAFLLFYRSRNVEETCKHRDPIARWTDQRPLPVTAVALLAAVTAVYYVAMSFSVPMFPWFGHYLTGWAGGAALLVLAAVDAYIAVTFLRLRVSGWWVATIGLAIRTVSAALTMRRQNLAEAYSHMGWSSDQLHALQANPWIRSGAFAWWSVGFAVIYLGFLLWLKRYFRPAAPTSYTGVSDALPNPSLPES